MKITNIEQKGDVFTVTKEPNFLERVFGCKIKYEKYADTGYVFHYFPHIRAYKKQNGKLLGPFDKMTDVIENWRRSF